MRKHEVGSWFRLGDAAMRTVLATTLAFFVSPMPSTSAAEALSGPIAAVVERVIDGDTLAVRARVWIGQEVTVLVRLAGIDVPEMKQGCSASRSLAVEAQSLVSGLIGGREVVLTNIVSDKYFGRVVAEVRTLDGADIAGTLIADGLARPYAGGKRCGWCGEPGVCRFGTSG